MDKNYEEMYEKILDYEAYTHAKNQRKIKTGIKVNILIPLVFLLLSFAVPDSGFLFLMLWIISLFGIAFYLIYIEYTDYKVRTKLQEFGLLEDTKTSHLMGNSVAEMEHAVDDRLDAIERRIAEEKKHHEDELERLNREKEEVKNEKLERLKNIGDKIRRDK